MKIPFVDLHAQYASMQSEIDGAIARVIANSTFAGGPEVAAFEKEFAVYCGAERCVGLSSGTAALELLLRAYEIGPGDEVIMPANTFFATAEAAMMVGATPVLVDVHERSGLIDPNLIEKAITVKTRAIIPVHLFGQPADMEEILAIARAKKILVIEDACQAHGARYRGKRAGALADAAAFSFYPGKNLGAFGDAGAITTGDAAVADYVMMFREHGMKKKYEHLIPGRTERMDGMQGAILRAKLKHLDDWNARRRSHAARYRELLAGMKNVTILSAGPELDEGRPADRDHVYHLFVIRVPNRDAVRAELLAAGIETGIHYPIPIHLQPAAAGLGYHAGDFPVSERLAKEILSLPMFPEMTEEQQNEIGEVLDVTSRNADDIQI